MEAVLDGVVSLTQLLAAVQELRTKQVQLRTKQVQHSNVLMQSTQQDVRRTASLMMARTRRSKAWRQC